MIEYKLDMELTQSVLSTPGVSYQETSVKRTLPTDEIRERILSYTRKPNSDLRYYRTDYHDNRDGTTSFTEVRTEAQLVTNNIHVLTEFAAEHGLAVTKIGGDYILTDSD